jgi:hypothetical protein
MKAARRVIVAICCYSCATVFVVFSDFCNCILGSFSNNDAEFSTSDGTADFPAGLVASSETGGGGYTKEDANNMKLAQCAAHTKS